ncbi:MAG: hypothetical protein HY344_00545 [Candidatus Levybacteria bacterium]|nr:hypothetical protein [Candidatus Levybacteria bacterium]
MNQSRIYIFLKNIWPSIYRTINNWFSFLLRVLKQAAHIAMRQIRP